jgi:hypothetical protein
MALLIEDKVSGPKPQRQRGADRNRKAEKTDGLTRI